MFDSREVRLLREENVALRAQLQDREGFIRDLLASQAAERRDLLDRLMAALQPAGLRAVRDTAPATGQTLQSAPGIPNLPGREVSLRPRRLPTPVRSNVSDIEAAADLERSKG